MSTQEPLFRHHRDRLTDLLPGNHFRIPIGNLLVAPEVPKVAFGKSANIQIFDSQPEVTYQIRTYGGTGWWESEPYEGNGATLTIETLPMTAQDYTFSVLARKNDPQLDSTLFQHVVVKVGVDTRLNVYSPEPVIGYHTHTELIVEATQPEVDYQAYDMQDQPLSEPISSGTLGGDLTIPLIALTENATLRIKSTNENHPTIFDWLITQVTIRVRPDRTLAVSADGVVYEGIEQEINPYVYDYHHQAEVTVPSSQSSTQYELRYEWIDDDAVDQSQIYHTPIVGALQGQAGDLVIPIPPGKVYEDFHFHVRAFKDPTPDGLKVEELLDQKLTILVRPDPGKVLTKEEIEGETYVKVHDTQPGVKYQLLDVTDPDHVLEVGRPGFHSRNFGINAGRVEREFSVGPFTEDHVLLPTGPITATRTFRVRATKVRTLLEALLKNEMVIDPAGSANSARL